MLRLLSSLLLLLPGLYAGAQAATPNLAQRLGYPADARLLIVHADDLGVAHSENQASFAALENGVVRSASIMGPCPWLSEVADYARQHPDHDLGMHLTLTSEWKHLKWGPAAGAAAVPSLVDSAGYFHDDCMKMARTATAADVEKELRAQIERARKLGINPTHLDSHMACLFYTNPEFFGIYLQLAREYGIPAMVSKDMVASMAPEFRKKVQPTDIVIDRILGAGPAEFAAGMGDYYAQQLRDLQPGVSVMIIHCAYDEAEMRGVSVDHPTWGAEWRQEDFDFFTSDKCKVILEEKKIQLITWKEVGKLLQRQP